MAALQAARKLALETQSLLVQYEQGNASSKPIVEAKLEQLQQIVKEIQKDKSSMAPGSLAGLHLQQLTQQCSSMRHSLDRASLLQTPKHSGNPALHSRTASKAPNDDTEVSIEVLRSEGGSLAYSHNMADQIIDTGESVIERLRQQNQRLRDIRTKVGKLGVSLGISKELMHTIERRVVQEKWLVYGGMVAVLVVFFLLWLWA